jgi:PHD/YefM family antitoxin component YafN of YafNO toxin-antitoxin module
MNERLEHFINLIAKTGDKLLVYDRYNPDASFVVVSLSEYERLTAKPDNVKGLTEDELIDKINRDISLWKEEGRQSSETPKGHNNRAWSIPESRRREAEALGAEANSIN